MSELSTPNGEKAVIGCLLAEPQRVGEIITELHAEHFDSAACRLLYQAIHDAWYGDTPIDAVTIATPMARKLAAAWNVDEPGAVERVKALTGGGHGTAPLREYAALIRRYAERRDLLDMAAQIGREVEEDNLDPIAIASTISQRSLALTSYSQAASKIVSFGDAGREFINTLGFEIEAARRGADLGVKIGMPGIDGYTRGRRPGRLYMVAGEPGVGKSAVEWIGALNFATAQARKPKGEQLGALVLSMEMGEQDSSTRFAQHLGHLDGEHIQDALVSQVEMAKLVNEWGKRKEIPLYMNYAPNLKCSQMLALVAEAVRRHNVVYVVVDHFRMFDPDRRLKDRLDEDEEKARFLKEQIARALNVAVVCIAHTRKPDRDSAGRPHMADLRGSGQIAAHADMVSFLYRPIAYADEQSIMAGDVSETDAEMIHRKNRQGLTGTGKLFFDPSKMNIR